MPRNKLILIVIAAVISVSCIIIAGHFLFWDNRDGVQDPEETNPESTAAGISNETGSTAGTDANSNGDIIQDQFYPSNDNIGYVTYKQIETQINGNKQVINIIEAKLGSGAIIIKPALSFGLIYGFEELSKMAESAGAYAGVNGGFFSIYGEPSGMVMIDGELCAKPTGTYPVFITDGKTASFEKTEIEMTVRTQTAIQTVDKINTAGDTGELVLYTPVYGTGNRSKTGNITYVIENKRVVDIKMTSASTAIPGDGMLLTYYTPNPEEADVQLKIGDIVSFEYAPDLGDDTQAYECGCMIVEDGRNVAPVSDPWIGVLTNRDPRTVIGIKDESTVVLMTVDGRQPGYSIGMTANELAGYLIGIGVKDAAMLDGGASTEMIVEGKVVNRPSHGAEERKIAGALLVFTAEGIH